MAFPKNGVVEAVKIVPSAFGLLAVVKPENSSDENQWTRGFSQEWDTSLNRLYLVDDTDADETQIAGSSTVTNYTEIKPFFIEVQETRSGLGFLGIDRIAKIKRQCEASAQVAMEKELWDGTVRIGLGHANRALVSSDVTVADGSGLSAKRALAVLEHGIADASDTGEQGLIHLTRDVTALLSSNSQMLFHDKEKEHLQTMGGTPVVVGSGYSGNGPRILADSEVSVSSNVVTVTNVGLHYLQTGDTITGSITSENGDITGFEGVAVTVTNTTTFTFPFTHANFSSEAVTAGSWFQMLATNNDKWIYATGTVKTYLGDVDVVNDNLAQAFDASSPQNDMRLKAIRPAAVYFDTSIHLAVRVDLTA